MPTVCTDSSGVLSECHQLQLGVTLFGPPKHIQQSLACASVHAAQNLLALDVQLWLSFITSYVMLWAHNTDLSHPLLHILSCN